MTNQEKLQNYLLGSGDKKGYLKSDLSNGKVIMLSGKLGSGKTHFWQNKIVPTLIKEENKIPNHYISLYGKTSIDEIKNEIFIKVFESVDSFESTEKTLDITKKSAKLVSMFSSTINVLGMSLDLSKATDKTFNGLENLLENKKLKKTEEYLNSGAIICFDDFERKSKEIDLNDLFGFITQLTLNFDCKIVIILNDDAFKGKEKNVFSNIKEKSVSKFLYYSPTIDELFDLIFDIKKYSLLLEYKEKILETITETKELNARVYIQVLDNLLEWIENKESNKDIVRCLILLNINFIRNHCSFIFKKYNNSEILFLEELNLITHGDFLQLINCFSNLKEKYFNDNAMVHELINVKSSKNEYLDDFIKNNSLYINALYFYHYKLKIFKNMKKEIFIELNDFIKTGILINE